MGLDWRVLSLSGYLEALEAYNEANDPQTRKSSGGPASEGLRKFMKAHGV